MRSSEQSETILILAANPLDRPYLGLDREVREIQNGLRRSRKHFEIEQVWAVRPKDLRRALLEYNPAYVHFCGHGAGSNGIVLEGHLVDGEALAGLFKLFSKQIKCVVLNACYSAVQADAISEHIDFVVGMDKAIGDSTAVEFAGAFYDALGAGESIEFAFELGRNAIQLAGIPEHLTPQLISRRPVKSAKVASQTGSSYQTHRHDWDGAPTISLLYGRAAAAELLKSWILDESCRIVLITGLGGIGKTDLATCLGRGGNRSHDTSETLSSGIHGNFDRVMWRSLLNAPPPEDLFADILGFLSDNYRSNDDLPQSKLEAILKCLRSRRCLVILDNVEAVLRAADQAVNYREGYERYGSFLEMVAKTGHQSCLLLTSREKPRAIANLEGARKPVRSLTLNGIGTTESQDLFGQIGTFSGTNDQWKQIVKLYNGNPLALELAARHIDQVYEGDLLPFLGAGRPVFGDLEELLDWHLDRLTDEETELVYWLAIEREPVNYASLYANYVSPVSRDHIASSLQTVQRRIPLERIARNYFTLQPVLIEHVTAKLVQQIGAALENLSLELPSGGGWSSSDVVSSEFQMLNMYSLVKATAREYIRDSQQRLILGPIAERLSTHHPRDLRRLFERLINRLHEQASIERGYATGNLINLMSQLKIDFNGANFSGLPIWQASLDGINLHNTDFSFADFHQTTFRHPFGTVFSVAYSPNGELIAIGDDNGEIRLFFVASGQLHMRFVGHSDVVWAVAFSPSGQSMASASFDGTLRVWDVMDGSCRNVLVGHEGWVYSVAFTPDGDSLASASEDGTCRIWDLKTGSHVTLRTQDPAFLAAVGFSPDGRTIAAAGSGGFVSLFSVKNLTQPTLLRKHTGRIRALAFSGQGDLLASGGEDQLVNLWRIQDGAHIGTLSGHTGKVTSLCFSADGDVLVSASDDHTVRLWSTVRKECVRKLQVSTARVWSVACSPTERTFATGSEDGVVRVWDIDTGDCLTTLRGYSNTSWSLAFSPDSSLLIAGNEDSIVRGWDVRYARTRFELRGHASRVWAVAASADGRYLASASDDLTVRIWDLPSGICRHVLRGHVDWVRTLAFDSDSRFIASGGEDGHIFVWDVASGHRTLTLSRVMNRVFSVEFCKEGEWLLAGGTNPDICVFLTEDGSSTAQLPGHRGWLTSLVAQGSIVASCSEDGTIKVWDITNLECIETLLVGCKVWCGTFCEGGEYFVSGSEDGTLRRWALRNGRCEAEVRVHEGSVWSVAVNSEDTMVATAGDDGAIRLWQLPDLGASKSPHILRPTRPYEGMNITGATGLTLAQREALIALGAIEFPV